MGNKVAPALAAGNTIIVKPASTTPLASIRCVEILIEAGLPPGVLNLVTGPGSEVGEEMLVNPIIRKLISEGEDAKISDAIRIGYQEGMVDFTENLRQLVERGDIDKATALEVAPSPEQLKMARAVGSVS